MSGGAVGKGGEGREWEVRGEGGEKFFSSKNFLFSNPGVYVIGFLVQKFIKI